MWYMQIIASPWLMLECMVHRVTEAYLHYLHWGRLYKEKLSIPPPETIPGAPELGSVPHVIVGDEAFPLKCNLMRPYPGQELDDIKRIFNYRLSRARRVVEFENAFGILTAKWGIYLKRIQLHPQNVDEVVKLHVFCIPLSNTPPRMHPATT